MEGQELRQVRAAKNQTLFRTVNDQLVGLNQAFEPLLERSAFVCECAQIDCAQTIEMTLQDYAHVREDPRRFLVAASPDHVLPDVERVVERTDAYFVVEKIGVAGQIAASDADGVRSTVSSTEKG